MMFSAGMTPPTTRPVPTSSNNAMMLIGLVICVEFSLESRVLRCQVIR